MYWELQIKEQTFNMDGENKIAVKQYHKYILFGDELNKTIEKAQDIFTTMIPQLIDGSASIDGWHRHDLYGLVRELIFEASVEPFLSKHLLLRLFFEPPLARDKLRYQMLKTLFSFYPRLHIMP